ncbi:MAG: hypothetical protein ABI867_16025 [Kofleriaceae bacterium]
MKHKNTVIFIAALATASTAYADDDEYKPIPQGKSAIVETCGRFKVDVESELEIGGKWTPYVYNVRGDLEKLPCSKLASKNKFGREVTDAVGAMKKDQEDPSIVVVQQGKAWTGSKDDGVKYRFITLYAHSKHMKASASPCGDDKTLCEAGGNTIGEVWNQLEFAVERAEVHAGKAPEKCKEQLKVALKKSQWITSEHDVQEKATYWKTHFILARNGKRVPMPEVLKRATANTTQLKAKLDGAFCKSGA